MANMIARLGVTLGLDSADVNKGIEQAGNVFRQPIKRRYNNNHSSSNHHNRKGGNSRYYINNIVRLLREEVPACYEKR